MRNAPLTEARAREEGRRRELLKGWHALRDLGFGLKDAAAELGVAHVTLWRLVTAHTQHGEAAFQPKTHLRGRKPAAMPTDEELALVRRIYLKLDESRVRGRGLGSSKVTAFRLAAKSDEPCVTEQFRRVVLKRKSKTLPPSWERLLDTPASVLAHARDSRSTMAGYVTTPRGRTYVNAGGEELPLRCGTVFESDDGTLNFYAWIPWPFGGDKCSDKFGVRLGRWQFLPVVDVHSEMCVAFDIVARNLSSYRGEDVAAILGRTMCEIARPEVWRLERGSWECDLVRGALDLAGVPVINAWHSKQKSSIERFFDRAWTPLSLMPGHAGRDRGRWKQLTDHALACQEGRHDPRKDFLSLTDATPRIASAVQFVNSEPIESRSGWGRWIPQERWQQQTTERAPELLTENFRVFFARERREWTVRGCVVGGSVDGPLVKFPVWFQCAELWEFEGCKVRCYFDPYTDPCLGTLVLADEWRGCKPGHVIARDVPALELPPQVVLAEEWSDRDAREKSLAIRKAISKAVRTESWSWSGARRSTARDGLGNSTTLVHGGASPRTEDGRQQPARSTIPAALPPARRGAFAPLDAATRQKRSSRFAEEAALATEQRQEITNTP